MIHGCHSRSFKLYFATFNRWVYFLLRGFLTFVSFAAILYHPDLQPFEYSVTGTYTYSHMKDFSLQQEIFI